jgi:hypothetical protein
MKQFAHGLAAGALASLLASAPTSAQQPRRAVAGCAVDDPAKFHTCAVTKMKTFNPPRTPDGVPNMQGLWERVYLSQNIEAHPADGLNTQAGPSLIVDTPDRKIPYQPWAMELRKEMATRFISPLAACLVPGVPRYVIAPGPHQILQRPGQVVHLLEYSHSHRVIPTTPQPHLPDNVRLYLGDSRGRWEGNTLVVDVTNVNGLTWIDNAGNFFSDRLHVMERFTMVDANTIHYEARIDDPQVYTRPWTMVSALTRNTELGFELFEQACHEGNQSVEESLTLGMKVYRGVAPPAR